MKRIGFLLMIMGFFFLFLPLSQGRVFAANFSFDKTTVQIDNNQTFNIAVSLNPGSDSIFSADIHVRYDNSVLKVNNVSYGSLFPTVNKVSDENGDLYIAAMVNDPASSISSSGVVATITFQGIKKGTTTLTFDCSTSKIVKNDANGTNVMVCNNNGSSSIIVGSGGSSGGSSSSESYQNDQKQIQELPRSGIFDNIIKVGIPGLVLVLVGVFLKGFII